MGFYLFLFVVSILIASLSLKVLRTLDGIQNYKFDNPKLQAIQRDENSTTFYKRVKHIGGYPSFCENESLYFKIKNNEIYFEEKMPNISLNGAKYKSEHIPLDNLINYEIQTETEISKNITLTRIIGFGVLAPFLKKESKEKHYFLVLTLKKNDIEFQCIFKNYNADENLNDILTLINKLKIEQKAS